MGTLNFNSDDIQEISIERITETKNDYTFDVIHLGVISETRNLKYRISGDERFTIDYIESKLNQFKDEILHPDSSFGINEYLERFYIYVTYPDGETDQYTAHKISE